MMKMTFLSLVATKEHWTVKRGFKHCEYNNVDDDGLTSGILSTKVITVEMSETKEHEKASDSDSEEEELSLKHQHMLMLQSHYKTLISFLKELKNTDDAAFKIIKCFTTKIKWKKM